MCKIYKFSFFLFERRNVMGSRHRNEGGFQDKLREALEEALPDWTVIKQETLQGFPDLLCIKGKECFCLECKKSKDAAHQPNQDTYVEMINNDGGFARFIYPENKKEIMDEILQTFGT